MIYFTSDLHFNHDREFIYKPRGFSSIEEMNEEIIRRWNEIVTDEDDVYVLGDLMLLDNQKGIDCLRRLKGNIIVIYGNHDTAPRIGAYNELFDCLGYAQMIKIDKYQFYLSHYPTYTSNLENNAYISEHIINLHGHTHSKSKFYQDIPFMYNVSLDAHDCYPVRWDAIVEDIKAKVKECKDML